MCTEFIAESSEIGPPISPEVSPKDRLGKEANDDTAMSPSTGDQPPNWTFGESSPNAIQC
jgi:hypothetical protein